MTSYILVHGAFHGGWCWFKVLAELEARGRRARAPDLPGHGRNRMPGSQATYQNYVDSLVDILRAESEPVVLVGHSMAGAVITGAAEAVPEKVARMVYLAAVIGPSGATMIEGAPGPSEGGVIPAMVPASDGGVMIEEAAIGDFFYGDCSAEDVVLARLCLTPQAMEPMTAPVVWTPERCGRIPRLFIACMQDKVSGSIAHQRARAEAMPGTVFVTLDSSHSPFLSMPRGLVDLLEAGLA